MKKSLLKHRPVWLLAGLLLVASIAGIIYWTQSVASAAETTAPVLQTSKVRTGDLVVSASGSGNVLSSAQADLGFRSNGIVAEVYVTSSQQVKKGDILASLDNTSQKIAFTQAEATIKTLFSEAGIAAYQIEAVNAEIAYNDALGQSYTLNKPVGSSDYIAILRSAYLTAQDKVVTAEENFNRYVETPDGDIRKAQALASLAQARIDLKGAKANLAYYESNPDTLDSVSIQANLDLAEAKMNDAQTALAILKAGYPEALEQTLAAADGTSLEKLKLEYLAYENARIALENTRLIAPFDGVVINLNLVPGQSVSANPVLTLAALESFQVKFFMDETDLAGLAVGNRVVYTFNAYPETSLDGKVTLIERALQTVDGSPVVVVWGSLPERPSFTLLAGMTVDVEVIAGEAQKTLIVPVQALRELSPGSFAVFVVQSDSSLKLTPVTIGLRDFANAEILSGLKMGDVVSTGTVETK